MNKVFGQKNCLAKFATGFSLFVLAGNANNCGSKDKDNDSAGLLEKIKNLEAENGRLKVDNESKDEKLEKIESNNKEVKSPKLGSKFSSHELEEKISQLEKEKNRIKKELEAAEKKEVDATKKYSDLLNGKDKAIGQLAKKLSDLKEYIEEVNSEQKFNILKDSLQMEINKMEKYGQYQSNKCQELIGMRGALNYVYSYANFLTKEFFPESENQENKQHEEEDVSYFLEQINEEEDNYSNKEGDELDK